MHVFSVSILNELPKINCLNCVDTIYYCSNQHPSHIYSLKINVSLFDTVANIKPETNKQKNRHEETMKNCLQKTAHETDNTWCEITPSYFNYLFVFELGDNS